MIWRTKKAKKNPVQEMRLLMISLVHYLATKVLSRIIQLKKTSEENNSEYDLQNDPAFPTAKAQTQHSVYCLPDTWDTIDGSSGLLFEAEIKLRRSGYGSVQKRELHNALLLAAAKQLTVEDISEAFIQTRENRKSGELIETKQ